eukprot:TRINITY_DN3724_c0_g2_i3.p1 TRINITY_DN3724_c0_g2~~TRINITY_DN3724_c0_g2_i3.p1  ORF type:complete len:748 (+),score=123.58 TRINITY_DN3724_c0_g2_i3:24-2267(+)
MKKALHKSNAKSTPPLDIQPSSQASLRQTMQSSFIHQNFDPETKCPVCLQLWKDPRSLPCGHVVCESCICKIIDDACSALDEARRAPFNPYNTEEKLTTAYHPLCPLCCHSLATYKKDMSVYPLSKYHQQAVIADNKLEENESPLMECMWEEGCQQPVTYMCEDGCGYLCKVCCSIHSKARLTRSHQVSSTKPEMKVVKGSYQCWRHPHFRVTHSCQDCKTNRHFCVNCAHEHKIRFPHHQHADYAFDLQEKQEQVGAILAKAKDIAAEYLSYEALISAAFCELDADVNKAKAKVKATIDAYVAHLEAVKNEVFQQIDETAQKLTKKHRAEMLAFTQRRDMIALAEELFSSGCKEQNERTPNKLTYAEEILQGIINNKMQPSELDIRSIDYYPSPRVELWLQGSVEKHIKSIGYAITKCKAKQDQASSSLKQVQIGEQKTLLKDWRPNPQPCSIGLFEHGDQRYLYLLSQQGVVQKVDVQKKLVLKNVQVFAETQQNSPCQSLNQIKVSENGIVAVLHHNGACIYLLTTDLLLLKKIPTSDFIQEVGNKVHKMDFDKNGQLFALTSNPQLLYVLDKDGKLLSKLLQDPRVVSTCKSIIPESGVTENTNTKIESLKTFCITHENNVVFLRTGAVDIYSMEGKFIKSVTIKSGHYFHVSSSPSGFIFLLGLIPMTLSPNGETLELLPTYRPDKRVELCELHDAITSHLKQTGVSFQPVFSVATKRGIIYLDSNIQKHSVNVYWSDLSTI